MDWYILNEEEEVVAVDMYTAAEWKRDFTKSIVAQQMDDEETIQVSTVFLGLSSNYFETMIFGGEHDQYQERYTNITDAREGHKKAVALAFPNE